MAPHNMSRLTKSIHFSGTVSVFCDKNRSRSSGRKLLPQLLCLPVAIVRPFNTYGPRQSARAVIPTIISQLLAGKEAINGSLTPTRDFNYVKDTAAGFIAIAESDKTIDRKSILLPNRRFRSEIWHRRLFPIIIRNAHIVCDRAAPSTGKE